MMNNARLENEILKYTKGLSTEALQEVIEYLRYLNFKKNQELTKDGQKIELSKLDTNQTTHLEQEFNDYKKRYPRE